MTPGMSWFGSWADPLLSEPSHHGQTWRDPSRVRSSLMSPTAPEVMLKLSPQTTPTHLQWEYF